MAGAVLAAAAARRAGDVPVQQQRDLPVHGAVDAGAVRGGAPGVRGLRAGGAAPALEGRVGRAGHVCRCGRAGGLCGWECRWWAARRRVYGGLL